MIQPKSIADQVYEHLLREILAGQPPPGSPLREGGLAERLGVSRTPVREALGRLADYGVVETRTNHSAVVRRLGRAELAHLHQVREALEGMAAELACDRLSVADLERLEALGRAAGEPGGPDDLAALDTFDVELHRLLAERSGNPILAREVRKLQDLTMLIQDQLEWVLSGCRPMEPAERLEVRRICWAQHLSILEAIRARDPDGARRAMVEHIRASCRWKLQFMPEATGDVVGDGDPTGQPARRAGEDLHMTANATAPGIGGTVAGGRRRPSSP